MEFVDLLKRYSDDWIFNSLGIENFNSTSRSRLRHWFAHARQNHGDLPGDILEFGVYKGGGVLAMALLLKSLGSSKKIYAFDSFSGFPGYDENDDLSVFEKRPDIFEQDLIAKAKLCKDVAEWRIGGDITPENISTSGDFSDASKVALESKIAKFGLDNIEVIEGDFSKSIPNFLSSFGGRVFSANIDCDLYDGYKQALEPTFDRCVKGAMIYLDEYYSLKFPGARVAVHEFLEKRSANVTLLSADENDFERWAIIKEDV
jgi:hypothetical protein